MSEIKTSKNGVDYAPRTILKIKKRVYSKAVLMKIPHHRHEYNDISLKIGRYNCITDEVAEDKPKSELTLDNEELNALIKYISEYYTPVSLGCGEYVNISGDNAGLIRQFKELVERREDTASLLIDNEILTDNVLVAATSIRKTISLKSFERALMENNSEQYWQDWFSNNKWILGSDFAQIIDERHIDVENIADYIMRAFDGFIDLVEIKKPNGINFWAATKDHNNYVPSTDLIKAITQCMNYLHAVELEANSVKFTDRLNGKVVKPRCTLVFGRSNDWDDEQKEAYRILNSSYNQLSILTYDHLLTRAQNVLGVDILEDEVDDYIPF